MTPALFILLFFIVAFLYAAVGHGGASAYLAVLVLAGQQQEGIRSMALTLNLLVAGIAFVLFFNAGHFRKSLFYPLAAGSVPCAWIGAHVHLPGTVFKLILGILLIFGSIRLIYIPDGNKDSSVRSLKQSVAFVIGAGIGLISGMIGIGGGILLSPLLLIGKWSSVKESAAVAAPFILVNSIAALSALDDVTADFSDLFWYWVPAVLIGGTIGAYMGSKRLTSVTLRYFLALVLVLATGKLIWN